MRFQAVFTCQHNESRYDSRTDRDAAGEIFAERGFDGTTVRDICQRAGANIAAVNYYFGDKQRLYVEAVVQAHRWRMEQAPLPDWADGHAAGNEARRLHHDVHSPRPQRAGGHLAHEAR